MESIKHKMMVMANETADAFAKAERLGDESLEFIQRAEKFEKLIIEMNKGK